MAGEETPESHQSSFPWPIFLNSFHTIGRTGGGIAALGSEEGRDEGLVEADEPGKEYGKDFIHEVASFDRRPIPLITASLMDSYAGSFTSVNIRNT